MSYRSDQKEESSCELGSCTGSRRFTGLWTYMSDSSENRSQFKADTGKGEISVWGLHPFHLVTDSSVFRQAVICRSFEVCLHAQVDLDFSL